MPIKSERSLSTGPSEKLEHTLRLYATAAVAAGVSILAMTQSADAKVVTTTKTIFIPINHPVTVDMNNDGIADVQFSLTSYSADCKPDFEFMMKPLNGAAVVGGPFSNYAGPYASALAPGAKIGPSAHFAKSSGYRIAIERSNFAYCSFSYHRSIYGHWGGNPKNRYIGVRFPINGTTHYGWISLSSNFVNRKSIAAHINSYAYETVANRRILAGSTTAASAEVTRTDNGPSLGMLAMGSDGLVIWRREEDYN